MVAQRRYRLLVNVIESLPRGSAYGEMVLSDEDAAASAPDAPKREWRPSIREWTPEVELMAAVHDLLIDVIQVQHDKKVQHKPWPRPMTAREVLKRRESQRRRARVRELFRPQEGGA